MKLAEKIKSTIYPVPAHLKKNWRTADMNVVRRSIETHYHKGWRSKGEQSPEEYARDLKNHLHVRLDKDRVNVVPWLDAVRPLKGLRVLEIGCGTGASTVALAEQGAQVTGIDIDEDALQTARDRCAAYQLQCELKAANIAEFRLDAPYDLVIFFACLEHMTIAERLVALKQIWAQLAPSAMLAVVGTPNRMWFFDDHTSRMRFFNWLPDELAFHYAKFSPRQGFNDRYDTVTPDAMEHFLRCGRGVSYHEFDLAIGRNLKVVSSLSSYRRWHRIGKPRDWLFKSLLRRMQRGVHEGFFDPYLDLVIRKS